jgi:hypothetical protein
VLAATLVFVITEAIKYVVTLLYDRPEVRISASPVTKLSSSDAQCGALGEDAEAPGQKPFPHPQR